MHDITHTTVLHEHPDALEDYSNVTIELFPIICRLLESAEEVELSALLGVVVLPYLSQSLGGLSSCRKQKYSRRGTWCVIASRPSLHHEGSQPAYVHQGFGGTGKFDRYQSIAVIWCAKSEGLLPESCHPTTKCRDARGLLPICYI